MKAAFRVAMLPGLGTGGERIEQMTRVGAVIKREP
jgi:hypothetical protein